MSSQRLEITETTGTDGVVGLCVGGEVDVGTVGALRAAIGTALGRPGVRRLVLDLGPLRFLDSSGIAALIGGQHDADARGVRFGLINCTGTVRNVLDITGMYDLLAAEPGM